MEMLGCLVLSSPQSAGVGRGRQRTAPWIYNICNTYGPLLQSARLVGPPVVASYRPVAGLLLVQPNDRHILFVEYLGIVRTK